MSILPARDSTRGSTSNGWPWVGLSYSLVAAIVMTVLGTFVVPEFSSFYASSGASLPLVTRLFAHFYLLSWAAPVAAIAAWRFWPVAGNRHRVAAMIGLGAILLFIPITIFALYLPIFGLAAAI